MINLPKVTDLDISGKKVLLRLDLDCEPDPNELRIKAAEETLGYLKEKGAQIVILAHRGRPGGAKDDRLSLRDFQPIFSKWGARAEENLRFDPGEEKNDPEFAQKLAGLGEVFVNEAFATSHRDAASITGLPRLLPHAAGFRFIQEVENLSKVFDSPKHPVVFIVGGSKKDKLGNIEALKNVADKILVGGRLPEYIEKMQMLKNKMPNGQIVVANLLPDKEDMTLNSIDKFKQEIASAGTIVLAGPMGKYETEGHLQATERIFKAVALSSAFKITGGGDSLVIIKRFNLTDKFDWVSVGGGAMLEFLAKRTLPGIQALMS